MQNIKVVYFFTVKDSIVKDSKIRNAVLHHTKLIHLAHYRHGFQLSAYKSGFMCAKQFPGVWATLLLLLLLRL